MNIYRSKLAAAIILALSLVSTTFAQQAQPTPTQPQATTAPTPRGPDYVDFTGFKSKVFDVKHRAPRALVEAMRSLGSGFKGATIQFSDEFKIITVRDFPENIAAVEEALKRLDTPQAAQPDIELRMHVLLASNVEGVTSQLPTELNDVAKQLQSTLSYKSYTTLATVTQRVSEGSRNVHIRGTAEVPAKFLGREQPENASYDLNIQYLTLTAEPSSSFTVELKETSFSFRGSALVGGTEIRTSLSVRSGEKVVVGTATLGNKGLILVLSARVSK